MWKARRPKQGLTTCGESNKIIFHHTAGHFHQLDTNPKQSRAESIQYARDIQEFHMVSNGWNDSGHNFLVCRNGIILQGRWLTVSAIQAGHMVVSAHCPGQNQQIGIEHEHLGSEEMTKEQKESSSNLMAWIAWHYERTSVLPVMPHSKYFPTACPANLTEDIADIAKHAQVLLNNSLAV